jgi:hypothetical protein
MFEEIEKYEISGVMSEEDKKEILSILDFLTVFARGYCYNLEKPKNNFNNALNIWVAKMCNWGWAQRTVAELIRASTAKAGSHVKVTSGIIRPFPQFERRPRKHKTVIDEEISLDNLLDQGADVIAGNLKQDTLKAISAEERQRVIKSLTKIQVSYFDLFDKGLTVEQVAEELNKSISNVKKVYLTLKKKFEGIKFSQILNPSIEIQITEGE